MTAQTFTALFDSYTTASEAVRRLETAGIAHDRISLVSNDPSHAQYKEGSHPRTGTGASLGTILGGGAGLLAGLGLLAIPGLGPVVAAGWLASTLVGAGVGAAAGGIVGALTDVGVSREDAHAYAEGIQRGGTLVTVRGDDAQAAQITDILDKDGSVDLDQRTRDWRDAGWTGTHGDDTLAQTPPGRPLETDVGSPQAPNAGTYPGPEGASAPRVRRYNTTI